ncbi:molybdate ABC transporter substrate-binding protein [Parasphingorhabdus sp.]|uniref:molybdate ABC transporter substrate-binding protein n=1 Tax=Parasphingorhabdus sp. TaxID=2709688 RepID=UPI002F921C92
MLWTRRTIIAAASCSLLTLTVTLSGCGKPAPPDNHKVTIFAAASLKNALDAATGAWAQESGHNVTISYAGSATLAKQIEQGAPADMFISANAKWMDYLAERSLIDETSRSNLLGNRLVLIAPKGSDVSVKIESGLDLAGALDGGKLAMANSEAVPAGIYGKEALGSLHVWNMVQDHIAQAQDVRAALALVSRGEAPLGIVYQTDASADPDVRVVDIFPDDTHEAIAYPIALLTASKDQAAQELLGFLTSKAAAHYFEEQGFTMLNQKD